MQKFRKTPGPWLCDTCGQTIEHANDGMVQWYTEKSAPDSFVRPRHCFSIVHHDKTRERGDRVGSCYLRSDFRESVGDEHLERMLPLDGRTWLLSMCHDGSADPREITRLLMRLTIPGYDIARPYFAEAISEQVIGFGYSERPGVVDFVQVEEVRRVLRHYKPADWMTAYYHPKLVARKIERARSRELAM